MQDAAPSAPALWPPFTVRGAWPDASRLRYAVELDGGPVAEEVCVAAAERGLQAWAALDGVGFVAAADRASADIVFAWGQAASESNPDAPFGRDTSVAQTGPLRAPCEVLFDPSQEWREQGDGPSFYQAAVHEIGHALGLGHSPDPESVVYPQREGGRVALSASDRAGVCSLYGGGGAPGAGDLVVGERGSVLRAVAPPGLTDWCVFDTDGDGDDELLVWAVADVGDGGLVAYHFAQGPRLARTVGPLLGVAGPGAEVRVLAFEGRRYLEVECEGVRRWRPFDAEGRLGTWTWPLPEVPRADVPARVGDFDGDGREDRVRPGAE